MIDVDVRDFQSIEHATVSIDGFTALVGRSNIGKSALVRAIKAALTGAGGTSFVRHSTSCARRVKKAKTCECFCIVHLRAPGFDLRWEKGDKVNRYTFNGQVYDRTAQGTPEFLLRPQLTQDFDAVSVARESKLLQVSDQFDNVFLLDQTGGVVADVLSDVARLDCINVAMRLVEKDRKDATSTRKVREADIADLDTKLESFRGLDTTTQDVLRVERLLSEVQTKQQSVECFTEWLGRSRVIGSRLDELRAVCDIDVPDFTSITEHLDTVVKLVRFHGQANEKALAIRTLAGVEAIRDLDPQALPRDSARLQQLVGWALRMQAFQTMPGQIRILEASEVPPLDPITVKYGRFTWFDGLISKLRDLKVSITTLESNLTATLAEEQVVQAEISTLGVCPTCANPVSPSHSHSMAG